MSVSADAACAGAVFARCPVSVWKNNAPGRVGCLLSFGCLEEEGGREPMDLRGVEDKEPVEELS